MATMHDIGAFLRHRGVLLFLHIVILALSVYLVVLISIDTFNGVDFYEQPHFAKEQLWICVVFLADFFIEFFMSEKKGSYLASHFLFLIVSIPWQAIIYKFGWHYGWHFSKEFLYIIRFMPLIRGGYAMAIVVGWFTSNRATGLFFSYIITLLSTVYFASLTFFLFEKGVNKLVNDYSDALWWAAMDVTTVGSNIVAVTGVGRVLSVLLAALGMMMFPIFTVYVTNLITKHNEDSGGNMGLFMAFRDFVQKHPAPDAAHAPVATTD